MFIYLGNLLEDIFGRYLCSDINNIKQSLPVYWKPLLLPYYSRGRYDSRSSAQNKCLVYLHVESIRLQTSVSWIIHD